MKLTAASAIILVLAGLSSVILVPPAPPARMLRRHARARELMDRVADAVRTFHRERGRFPPRDGNGSADLVRALGGLSHEGVPYLVLPGEMLTPLGDIRDPMDPERSVFHCRAHRTDPGFEGSKREGHGFDLWCRSLGGEEIGVSDWAPAVSRP